MWCDKDLITPIYVLYNSRTFHSRIIPYLYPPSAGAKPRERLVRPQSHLNFQIHHSGRGSRLRILQRLCSPNKCMWLRPRIELNLNANVKRMILFCPIKIKIDWERLNIFRDEIFCKHNHGKWIQQLNSNAFLKNSTLIFFHPQCLNKNINKQIDGAGIYQFFNFCLRFFYQKKPIDEQNSGQNAADYN